MFEAKKLDEISKGLLEAANLIEKKGWWDGSRNGFFLDGKVCAGLAICEVFHNKEMEASKAFVRLALQAGVKGREDIPRWNDQSNAETVVRTIREAAYNQG